MRPRCFDRPPLPEGEWMSTGRFARRIDPRSAVRGGLCSVFETLEKPIFRWRESPFDPNCKAYDAPKIEDSPAWRERWHCHGCRWLPDAARYRATLIDSGARLAERQRTQQDNAQ